MKVSTSAGSRRHRRDAGDQPSTRWDRSMRMDKLDSVKSWKTLRTLVKKAQRADDRTLIKLTPNQVNELAKLLKDKARPAHGTDPREVLKCAQVLVELIDGCSQQDIDTILTVLTSTIRDWTSQDHWDGYTRQAAIDLCIAISRSKLGFTAQALFEAASANIDAELDPFPLTKALSLVGTTEYDTHFFNLVNDAFRQYPRIHLVAVVNFATWLRSASCAKDEVQKLVSFLATNEVSGTRQTQREDVASRATIIRVLMGLRRHLPLDGAEPLLRKLADSLNPRGPVPSADTLSSPESAVRWILEAIITRREVATGGSRSFVELDLHGMSHDQVPEIMDWLLQQENGCDAISVVTGYSDRMQHLVMTTLRDRTDWIVRRRETVVTLRRSVAATIAAPMEIEKIPLAAIGPEVPERIKMLRAADRNRDQGEPPSIIDAAPMEIEKIPLAAITPEEKPVSPKKRAAEAAELGDSNQGQGKLPSIRPTTGSARTDEPKTRPKPQQQELDDTDLAEGELPPGYN